MPASFTIYTERAGWLLSAAAANNVSGTLIDCRGAAPWSIWEVKCTGNSALVDFLYSPDGVDWATGATITATNGATAYTQFSAYYPFVNVATRAVYSAAGGSARVYSYFRAGNAT